MLQNSILGSMYDIETATVPKTSATTATSSTSKTDHSPPRIQQEQDEDKDEEQDEEQDEEPFSYEEYFQPPPPSSSPRTSSSNNSDYSTSRNGTHRASMNIYAHFMSPAAHGPPLPPPSSSPPARDGNAPSSFSSTSSSASSRKRRSLMERMNSGLHAASSFRAASTNDYLDESRYSNSSYQEVNHFLEEGDDSDEYNQEDALSVGNSPDDIVEL